MTYKVPTKKFSGTSQIFNGELAGVLQALAQENAKRCVVSAAVAAITDNGGGASADGTIGAISVPSASKGSDNPIAATGSVNLTGGNASNGDTFVIAGVTYTFESSLTNVAGHVKLGASAAASIANLVHAINATGGVVGTDYATACVANPYVTAAINDTTTVADITSISTVAATGNAITLAKTGTNPAVSGATLSGGSDTGGVQKAATETAFGLIKDAITELGTKAEALCVVLPVDSFDDSSGGTAADGTIGAITQTLSAVTTSFAASAGYITFAEAARAALATLGIITNKLRKAVGLSALTIADSVYAIYPMVIPALSTGTGTAATAGATANLISKTANDAFLASCADAVKELSTGLNAVRAVTAPTVAAVVAVD